MKFCFSKQYGYFTNHLHLYVTNYYIFVCTITRLLINRSDSCECQYFLRYNIYTYCNIWPNWLRSYGPIFVPDIKVDYSNEKRIIDYVIGVTGFMMRLFHAFYLKQDTSGNIISSGAKLKVTHQW